MRLQLLYELNYQVVAVMDGEECDALDFISDGPDSKGLKYMLSIVAEKGLAEVPSAWFHSSNPAKTIYAFTKGSQRLFFFKGAGTQIAVCTAGGLKKGQKADKALVARAEELRETYMAAIAAHTIEVIHK